MEKLACLSLKLSAKGFSHWISTDVKIWIANSVSTIQHMGNRKKSFLMGFCPIDQAKIVK